MTLIEGVAGIFGFAVTGIFKIDFSVFVPKTSVFPFWWLLRSAVSLLFRSRFPIFGKNIIGFSGLLFDAIRCFPVSPRKYASQRSQPRTRLPFCLRFWVLSEICFGFAVFYYFLYGFAVSNILQCTPPY